MQTKEEDALAAGRVAGTITPPKDPQKPGALSQVQRLINVERRQAQRDAADLLWREEQRQALQNVDQVIRRDTDAAFVREHEITAITLQTLEERVVLLEQRMIDRQARIRRHWWSRVLAWILEGRAVLVLLLVVGLSACGDPMTTEEPPTPMVEAPTPVASGVLRVAIACPRRVSYWVVDQDGQRWDWTMAMGLFGSHAVDQMQWAVDLDGQSLPGGVHTYTLTEVTAFMAFGGTETTNRVTIMTDAHGRGSLAITCQP